jgi:aminocarboxymuconate-semialdehyde decarboxylase
MYQTYNIIEFLKVIKMSHSIIDTPKLGDSPNRYGPTSARNVSTRKIDMDSIVIDTHAHVLIPEAHDFISPLYNLGDIPFVHDSSPETLEIQQIQDTDRTVALSSIPDRLQVLETQGIDKQVIASVPNQCYYMARGEDANKVSRIVNDGMMKWVDAHPDKFVGLGTVPLQELDIALDTLDYIKKETNLKGLQILTNVNGMEISDDSLDKFWAKVEEYDLAVMLHPLGFSHGKRFGNYYFTNVIGNPLDTTVALHYIIFNGLLERYKNLKILGVHGGGFLPAYSGRIDHSWGARKDSYGDLPNPPTSYLKKLYFDTTVFTHEQLEYLVNNYGDDHVVLGTDYPYDMAEYFPVQHIVDSNLTDAQKKNVVGQTALKLFNIE